MLKYNFEQGKDFEGYYTPIKNTDTFISMIIEEFKLDDSFKELTIYGSDKYPLFPLKTVRKFLDIPKSTLEDIVKKYRSNQIIRNSRIKIRKVNKNGEEYLEKNSKATLLTKYGLYRTMFISDKPEAHAFQDFVFIVLDKLEEDGKVELKDALEAARMYSYKVEDERDQLLEKNLTQRYHLQKYKGLDECLADKRTFTISGDIDYMNLCLLKKLYLTELPVYITNDKYVISKYQTTEKKRPSKPKEPEVKTMEDVIFGDEEKKEPAPTSSSSIKRLSPEETRALADKYDLVEYDREFEEFEQYDFDTEETYYFTIHTFKTTTKKNPDVYRKIGSIDILDRAHYRAVVDKLNASNIYKTLAKGVYQASYDNIVDAAKTALNERLYDKLKDTATE
jgi:prophage antirepressor-like protein